MNAAHGLLADTWMHGGRGLWIPLMMIPMLLFWGAIIFGCVWLIRGTGRGKWGAPRETHVSKESPVEILERRFAEGALTEEDYRARRQVLVNGTAGYTGAHEDEPLMAPQGAEGRRW